MIRRSFLAASLLLSVIAHAQNVGINANGAAPDPSAILDINTDALPFNAKKGMLVPRVTDAQMNAIPVPATGLLVFNLTTGGFWYYDGTQWVRFLIGDAGWRQGGNSDIVDGVNFLGTTNNAPIELRVNNQFAGRVFGDRVTLGTLSEPTTGSGTVAIGHDAATGNSDVDNVIIGRQSGWSSNGQQNVYVGSQSGGLISGFGNTGIGNAALISSTGSSGLVTAVGYEAGRSSSVSFATLLGANAGDAGSDATESVAIGRSAGSAAQFPHSFIAGTEAGTEANTPRSVLIGWRAGNLLNGIENVFVGSQAGESAQGSLNVAVGTQAGWILSSGTANVLMGHQAGRTMGSGSSRNVAIGTNAGAQLAGEDNTLVGDHAGFELNGSGNTYVGATTGSTTSSDGATAVGAFAGDNGASFSALVGYRAGEQGASHGVMMGFEAGRSATGSANVLLGSSTARDLAGSRNVAIGFEAAHQMIGDNNVLVGGDAGRELTGSFNVLIGDGAAWQANTGSNSVIIGFEAARFGAQGSVVIGEGAAQNGVQDGVIIGRDAITTGSDNVLVGTAARVEGQRSIGIGSDVNMAGDEGVMIGYRAGDSTPPNHFFNTLVGTDTDGGNFATTALGYAARTQGNESTAIGAMSTAVGVRSTAVGAQASAVNDHTLILGAIAGVNGATQSTAVGIGTQNPLARLDVQGNFRYVDGQQAAGRVLVSDFDGFATWQDPVASTPGWGLLGNAGTNPAVNFVGTTDNQHLVLRAFNTELMRLHTAGRVEIGSQGAAVPAIPSIGLPKVWVASSNTNDDNIIFQASHNNPASSAAFISAKSNGTVASPTAVLAGENMGRWATVGYGTTSFLPAAGIRVVAEAAPTASHVPSRINFDTNNELQRMTIRSDGKVGIGTPNPASLLHVSLGASGATPNANAKLVLEDDASTYAHFVTPVANESGILFGTAAGSIRSGIVFNSAEPDGLDFRTGGNTGRMVIDATGQVGIGTNPVAAGPLTTLDVDGGLTLRRPADIVLAAGANAVTVGDRSYLRLSSTTASNTTTIGLSAGAFQGHVLILECSAAALANGFSMVDSGAVNLSATRVLNDDDTIMLIWNGTDWLEVSYTQN